jgi:hypothetical protein
LSFDLGIETVLALPWLWARVTDTAVAGLA